MQVQMEMQKCNARQPQLSADANATMARNAMKHERMKRNGKKCLRKGKIFPAMHQ